MDISWDWKRSVAFVGLLMLLVGAASTTASAAVPPHELDPVLSLTGDCSVSSFDPVPDPSCVGEPPAYPSPPAGPTQSNCNKEGCSSRFDEPRAVAIDPFGNEFVASYADSEAEGGIDVFDDEGKFITEIAAPNAKSIAVDSKGNVYVLEDNAQVVRYAPSSGSDPEAGELEYPTASVGVAEASFVGAVAVDPANDQLFLASAGSISRYKSAEEGNGIIESFDPDIGTWTEALAIDSQRKRLYVTFCPGEKTTECGVKAYAIDPPHTLLGTIAGSTAPTAKFASPSGRMGLAVEEDTGHLFVADIISAKTVYEYDEDLVYQAQIQSTEFLANISIQIAVSNGRRSPEADTCEYPDPEEREVPAGNACNRGYLFVPVLKSNGRVAAYRPPGQTPPVIKGVSTGGIGETEAELRASIFPGGAGSEYSFEITTQESFEAEGFAGAEIVGEGTISATSLTTEVAAFATGLSPGETYRFRARAKNELGEAEEEGQNEATFTTYEDAVNGGACPNEELRVRASALLPDCRAYELVTPADTNGRSPKGIGFPATIVFSTVHSSPAGDAVSFKIEGGALPGTNGVGSFEGDPYVARRSASGWTTELSGPTGDEVAVAVPGSPSPDQGYIFWTARIEGPLVVNGEDTEYIRYPDGHSELIGRGSLGTDPKVEGKLITDDAAHIVFETANTNKPAIQLEPNAPPTGTTVVYDRTIELGTGAEVTNVVSLLPGDVTPAAGQNASYLGASKDGEGIAFAIGGTLYLRVGNETTHEIGTGVEFAGVSEGGERIFYVEGGDLEAFDTGSEEVIEFSTSGNVTPVNVAAGGTRAYFVSPSVLGGTNPEGDSAQAGEQNLYLSEEGSIDFVATVTDRDVEGEPQPDPTDSPADGLGLWTDVVSTQPAKDPSRLNPDGSVLLFQSRAEITGYPASKFPQVYRYDSTDGRLHCISCIPTGVPAKGAGTLETYTFDTLDPPPFTPNGFVPNLTPNGQRVFFESDEALVSSDTDKVQDVYEWEEQGVGSCTSPGGCVYLISSGQSSRDDFLYAHSTNGNDVFFTTGDQLTGWDTSSAISIFNAKVGGGFPEPEPEEPCAADGCRPSVTPAPVLPSPAQPATGANDQTPRQAVKHCPKGKRKVKKNGKVRCVKKKQQKKQNGKGNAKKRTGNDRGVGK
jgi:hypothetical protein